MRGAIVLAALAARAAPQPAVIRRWPLESPLPIDDLAPEDAAAGPNGTVMVLGLKGSSACHDPDATCNQLRSNAPHVFYVTWCADTRGFAGISCDLDLGYRSAAGAKSGRLEYSLRGRGSAAADFTNASTFTFPDEPFAFAHFAAPSGKNDILTVFGLFMAEGNRAGDDLALTDDAGFCCRATFWGGGTTTGTLYVGDLKIRANSRAVAASASASAPPAAPSASVAPAAAAAPGGGYSGSALGGAAAAGAVLGGAAAAAAALALHAGPGARAALWRRATGTAAPGLATPRGAKAGEAAGLLAAARAASLAAP